MMHVAVSGLIHTWGGVILLGIAFVIVSFLYWLVEPTSDCDRVKAGYDCKGKNCGHKK